MQIFTNEKGQAVAGKTVPLNPSAFANTQQTRLTWLSGAGVLLNSRGTCLMIDPVLRGFDMPLLAEPPILPEAVPQLDAVLVTHVDGDHYSVETCQGVKPVCGAFHSTRYVAEEMRRQQIPGTGHAIDESFSVGAVQVTLTPVKHDWQNDFQQYNYRVWQEEDACGFWLDTPDGSVWLPGDSRLLEKHLHMPQPDMILFDFSNDSWHIGFEQAVQLANTYPKARLLCIHWGTVDAPDMAPFNSDPRQLLSVIHHPERLLVLAPGEEVVL